MEFNSGFKGLTAIQKLVKAENCALPGYYVASSGNVW